MTVNDVKWHKMEVFEECLNPLCKSPVTTHPKAIQPRLYCCDRCKMDTWALRRVSRLLLPLGSKGWEVLQNLKYGDSGGKAGAEILDPGAHREEFS